MQYLLIHTGAPDLAEAWDDEAWAALTSWLDETISSGVNIEGSPLRLDADATTVKVRNGELIVTDGPFAEMKEQIAGFDVLECADRDEAIEVARRHPMARLGLVVRPFRSLEGGLGGLQHRTALQAHAARPQGWRQGAAEMTRATD